MRTLIFVVVVSFGLAAPAHAKKHKKAHAKAAHHISHIRQARAEAAPQPIPTSNKAKEEYDAGEAQLAELKASRDVPVASLTNQASDDEVPGQRSK